MKRQTCEVAYHLARPLLFLMDPERAHERAINLANTYEELAVDWLSHPDLEPVHGLRFANGAGSNKNGAIPSRVLKAWGFDVNIVGTVTADCWEGNERPRIWRHPKEKGIVNCMSFPGAGASRVATSLSKGDHVLPVRANIGSTPQKEGTAVIDDLLKTSEMLFPHVQSWELNVSCPNTDRSPEKYQQELADILHELPQQNSEQPFFIKISPDTQARQLERFLEVCSDYEFITGFTATNTTSNHGKKHKGGASGDLVYQAASQTQGILAKMIQNKYARHGWTINSCGGVSTLERMMIRANLGPGSVETFMGDVREIQTYTPNIFQGPALIRGFKNAIRHYQRQTV